MRGIRWQNVLLAVVLTVALYAAAAFIANAWFGAPVARTLSIAFTTSLVVGAVQLAARRGGKRQTAETEGTR